MTWQSAANTGDRLGECPRWHPRARQLYWIDFYGPCVNRLDPASEQVETWRIPDAETIGSFAFATDGKLMLALDRGVFLFDPATCHLVPFADPTRGEPGIGYNDGKVDSRGRFWLGTYDIAEKEPRAALYRLSGDGQSELADQGFIVCNGPAFSPDGGVLYLSDTLGRRLLAYDLDRDTGRLGSRRLFSSLAEAPGLPDGLAVDSEGCLWCALYGAGEVRRFAPDARLLETVQCPARNVTSCCLGGVDLRTLYVTSGHAVAGEPADGGGSVFARQVECPGLPEPVFECG